jgi:hypothetical protein
MKQGQGKLNYWVGFGECLLAWFSIEGSIKEREKYQQQEKQAFG